MPQLINTGIQGLFLAAMNFETWLICGGRDFEDRKGFENAMKQLVASFGVPRRVVQGGALGADALAAEWAHRMGAEGIEVKADWTQGPSAGMKRNQRMLDLHKPTRVIAFPGGSGTADMTERAKSQGFEVIEVLL